MNADLKLRYALASSGRTDAGRLAREYVLVCGAAGCASVLVWNAGGALAFVAGTGAAALAVTLHAMRPIGAGEVREAGEQVRAVALRLRCYVTAMEAFGGGGTLPELYVREADGLAARCAALEAAGARYAALRAGWQRSHASQCWADDGAGACIQEAEEAVRTLRQRAMRAAWVAGGPGRVARPGPAESLTVRGRLAAPRCPQRC